MLLVNLVSLISNVSVSPNSMFLEGTQQGDIEMKAVTNESVYVTRLIASQGHGALFCSMLYL